MIRSVSAKLLLFTFVISASFWSVISQASEQPGDFLLKSKAATKIRCDYSYQSAPVANVQIEIAADGTPSPVGFLNYSGRSSQVDITAEPIATGELTHVWLNKSQHGNDAEMIVLAQRGPNGQSQLINHNMPFGQMLWGTCQFTHSVLFLSNM